MGKYKADPVAIKKEGGGGTKQTGEVGDLDLDHNQMWPGTTLTHIN